MKGLRALDKLLFMVNTVAAFLLILSYLIYYLPPQQFAFLSVLSLTVPLLIILNTLFFIYWLVKLKKQCLLSLVVLLIGLQYVNSLYNFSKKPPQNTSGFTVMNYNVRLFNVFNWLPSTSIKADILNFVSTQQPDVLCIQEFHENTPINLKGYKSYKVLSEGQLKTGQAIYSKFPILNSGSLKFPNTFNNAIYVDIKYQRDTIRVYNIHLQSSHLNTNVELFKKEQSKQLFNQVSKTFKIQQQQIELLLAHFKTSPHKIILSGDFNNTAYSYIYSQLKGNYKDAFEEAGSGFGRTYDFKFFPVRIDFILVDPKFKVNSFTTFKEKLSDHYPIKANIQL